MARYGNRRTGRRANMIGSYRSYAGGYSFASGRRRLGGGFLRRRRKRF